MQKAAADIVIFGGGVAGLWLLNRLREVGFSVLLFETNTLGGGQTYKSQGIIHGGMKYALNGKLTQETNALSEMPTLWRQCLSGQGSIDLSKVPILSETQYLWAPNLLTAKLTGFLAGVTLSSKVEVIKQANYPSVFQHQSFNGQLFSLDEMVIDVPILVRELVKMNQDVIFKIEPCTDEDFILDDEGAMHYINIRTPTKSVKVHAQQFIFVSGAGNAIITKKLQHKEVAMQLRPLHMVLVKTPFHYPLYAHCLGFDPRPRITITTHYAKDGSTIWYLGGLIAEEGVQKNSEQQIKAAHRELNTLFPWLNFNTAQFATFLVDRAEPLQKSGLKPESSYLKTVNNMMIAWPTKLALAPKLAEDILKQLEATFLKPQVFDARELRSSPIPPLASPIWEEAFCKNVA